MLAILSKNFTQPVQRGGILMDWILYAAGITVIAIGIIAIILSVAFVLYMEYPVDTKKSRQLQS